jgi:uncharacterized protein (TIGR02099 family)
VFLKITSGVFRGSGWIFLLLVVVVAAYLLLGRVVAYSVATNQEKIKDYLRDNGLQSFDVKVITGDWQIHDPALQLQDVVLAPEGNVALEIDRINVRLNSFRSLLSRSPVISTIEVSGLRFSLERDDAGIKIQGIPRGDGQFNSRYILDSVAHLDSLSVSGIDIEFNDETIDLRFESIAGDPLLIRDYQGIRQVSLPFRVIRQASGESVRQREIRVAGTYEGDPRNPDFHADLFVGVEKIALTDYLQQVSIGDRNLVSATLDTRAWLRIDPEEVDVRGEIRLTDLRASTGDNDALTLLDELQGTLRFHGNSFTSGRLTVPQISIRQGNASLSVNDISVAIDDINGQTFVAGKLPRLSVDEAMAFISAMDDTGLASERLLRALESVSPGGIISDIAFSSGIDGSDAKIVGVLQDIRIDAYLGVPAISRLNGFVSLQPDRGYLDIDNDAFEMNFQSMFNEAWPFDSGRGRVAYEVGESQVTVSSGLIELIKGDLEAYGKVAVNLPPERDLQNWGLTIGIGQAELLEVGKYIPLTVSADVIDWLDTAIQSGVSPHAGLNIHGALFRGAAAVRKSYDIYLGIENTVIEYHPDWPEIQDITALVHVDNYGIRSKNVSGRILSSDIPVARVTAEISPDRKVDTIMVEAVATGPFSDGLTVLQTTPLAEATSQMAEAWSGEGRMSSLLNLNVPIGDRREEDVFANVRLEFNESKLVMPDFDLRIDELTGTASYRSDSGLSSSGFNGYTFDEQLRGSISTNVTGDGGEVIVALEGAVASDDLYDWADQVLVSRLEGKVNYDAWIHVPFGGDADEAWVVARTDLTGVRVDLPHPLAKSDPEESQAFEYRQLFLEDGNRVEMTLGENLTASLKLQDGLARGGRIHLGQEPVGIVTYDAVRMSGHLDYLDIAAWMDTIDELGEVAEVSLEDAAARYVESATLVVDELQAFGLLLEDAQTHVTRQEDTWLARIENEMLVGDVLVPDDDLAPIKIDLERISFVSEEGDADPLADIDPLEIDPIDFSTARLTLDDEDFGSWSFKFRTDENTARFENLIATAAGVDVQPGSQVEWRTAGGEIESRFLGSVVIDDLSDALTKFGFASSIEGSDLSLAADVRWPGSPAMVDVDTISGNVAISKGKGRFVQAETGGALKLLGVFDFASLARRFRLDFSDVIDKGFEFQDVKGVTSFNRGRISVQEPILITGSSGTFKVGGTVDLNSRVLDNDMIVTLPVSKTLPWYAAYSAIATGPLAGAGVMLAQRVFQNQINQMSSAKYRVRGTIEEPFIEFVSIFSDKVRQGEEQATEGSE